LVRLAPQRVAGAAFIGPMFPYTPSQWSVLLSPHARTLAFQRRMPIYRWWGRMNAVHWNEDYARFADWFISRCLPEPHSTKGIEDGVEWAGDTDSATLIATAGGKIHHDRRTLRDLTRNLYAPVLRIQSA